MTTFFVKCWECAKPIDASEEQVIDGCTFCSDCARRRAPGDKVNRPSHYVAANGMEVADFCDAFELDHHSASAIEYIVRAGRKDSANELEDLKKAEWRLQRRIKRVESRAGKP